MSLYQTWPAVELRFDVLMQYSSRTLRHIYWSRNQRLRQAVSSNPVRFREKGEHVRLIQTVLRRLALIGEFTHGNYYLDVDGKFGPDTEFALKRFQAWINKYMELSGFDKLSTEGVANRGTLLAMDAMLLALLATQKELELLSTGFQTKVG